MILGQKIILISIGIFSFVVILLLLFKTNRNKFFTKNNLIKLEKIMISLCILSFLCTIVSPSLSVINLALQILLVIIICKITIRFIINKPNKIYYLILSILFFIILVMQLITPIIV